MRAFPLVKLKAGINRLRTKGGASSDSLYDLVNGFVTTAQTLQSRPGTVITAALPVGTAGLFGYKGALHVFGSSAMAVPAGYVLDVIRHPTDALATLVAVHYVSPLRGALYVVVEFSDGLIQHYWLNDPGAWTADADYAFGDRRRPIADNGLAYEITAPLAPPVWVLGKNWHLADVVVPTVPNGLKYTITYRTIGTALEIEEPAWPTTSGATIDVGRPRIEWTANTAYPDLKLLRPTGFPTFDYYAQGPGVSGAGEPIWPVVLGGTVVDGTVTWKAFAGSYHTWTASYLYHSGLVEPVWPTAPGSTVVDGTITWLTKFKNVEDPNCPQTKAVIVAASKVFAIGSSARADTGANESDITRYCATNNPLDWTTADDAGFLPTGLQAQGSQEGIALGSYRGNLAWWSSSTVQIWNVDPDPAEMSLFDVLESAGIRSSKALAAVDNDLYWLSPLGVRSISVAVGSTNLQAGDIGSAIDVLINAKSGEAHGFYFPAQGQFWLAFPDGEVFVYTRSVDGKVGAWSRYLLPFVFSDAAQLDGVLYLRSGNSVYRFDKSLTTDAGAPIVGVVQWPHLDFGNFGITKMMIGFDIVGTGAPSVQFGYDQNNPATLTDPYALDPDTLTGGIVPFPLSAPSISTKITYTGAWSLNAVSLYLSDRRIAA